jgi:hypothetical protein
MATKKLIIETEVKTDGIDQAQKKLGQLKDLGKGLKIQYDIDGKPIDVVIDKSKNLQQQFKLVTAELRKTKEGTAEFAILSTKLGDIQDGLARTKAKAGDLFTSLQLLPGPVGEFASKINGAISALKLFTSFNLKDLRFQFKETVNDIKDVLLNLGILKKVQIENIAVTEANAVAKTQEAVATEGAVIANQQLAAAEVAEGVAAEGAAVATEGLALSIKGLISATVIGALIIGLIELGKYLYSLVSSEKAAEEANNKLAESFRMLKKAADDTQDAIAAQTEIDLIYAKAAGKTEDELTKIKQKGLNDRKAANDKALKDNLNAVLRNEGNLKITDEQRKKNEEDLNQEKIRLNGVKNDLLLEQEKLTANETLRIADKNRDNLKKVSDKQIEDNKAKNDRIINDTKTFYGKLLSAQNEYELLNASNEYEAEIIRLYQKSVAEEKEIEALKLKSKIVNGIEVTAEQQKLDLINQIRINYNKNVEKIFDKIIKDRTKNKTDELNLEIDTKNKIIGIQISMIEDEKRRRQEELKQKAQEEIEAMQFSKNTEKTKALFIETVNKKLKFDLDKLDEEFETKKREKQKTNLDDELKFLQLRSEALIQGTIEFFKNQREILKVAEKKELANLEDKAIKEKMTIEQIEKEKLAIKQKYLKAAKDISNQELQAILQAAQATLGVAQTIAQDIGKVAQLEQQVAMEEATKRYIKQNELDKKTITNQEQLEAKLLENKKKFAKEEDEIKRKAFEENKKIQIAQAIIATLQSAVGAFSSLIAVPFVGPVIAPIAAAAALVFGYKQVAAIKKTQYQSSLELSESETASAPRKNLGRNYADGGLIGGKRHAEGGTLIEAERGEAIMTRGAVTQFAPLLSLMNQAGGGASFNSNLMTTRQDNPILNNPAQEQAPLIVKTYVVSQELTTEAHRQARLKNLSTI